MIYILLALAWFLAGFCVASRDIRRKFGIPKKAIGLNSEGEFVYR